MTLLPRSRKWQTALLTVGVLAVCGGWLIYYSWPTAERFYDEQDRLHHYRTTSDPVLRALANGNIKPGDSVEQFIKDYSLERSVVWHDNYVTAIYRPQGAP